MSSQVNTLSVDSATTTSYDEKPRKISMSKKKNRIYLDIFGLGHDALDGVLLDLIDLLLDLTFPSELLLGFLALFGRRVLGHYYLCNLGKYLLLKNVAC